MNNRKQPKVYAVHHKNQQIRDASRSGGIFTAISDAILNNDGIVYGCTLDNNFKAVHIRANNTENRNKIEALFVTPTFI